MITAILLLAMLQPQDAGLTPASGGYDDSAGEDRENDAGGSEALAAAKKAVADAQDQLIKAKAALKGTTDGIELAHHANTDCGCYVDSTGRDYDKVEYKGDSLIIQHIHEAPPSLSKKTAP